MCVYRQIFVSSWPKPIWNFDFWIITFVYLFCRNKRKRKLIIHKYYNWNLQRILKNYLIWVCVCVPPAECGSLNRVNLFGFWISGIRLVKCALSFSINNKKTNKKNWILKTKAAHEIDKSMWLWVKKETAEAVMKSSEFVRDNRT